MKSTTIYAWSIATGVLLVMGTGCASGPTGGTVTSKNSQPAGYQEPIPIEKGHDVDIPLPIYDREFGTQK